MNVVFFSCVLSALLCSCTVLCSSLDDEKDNSPSPVPNTAFLASFGISQSDVQKYKEEHEQLENKHADNERRSSGEYKKQFSALFQASAFKAFASELKNFPLIKPKDVRAMLEQHNQEQQEAKSTSPLSSMGNILMQQSQKNHAQNTSK